MIPRILSVLEQIGLENPTDNEINDYEGTVTVHVISAVEVNLEQDKEIIKDLKNYMALLISS